MTCGLTGAGRAGKYTREAGFAAYYEICGYLQDGYVSHYEEEQKANYAYKIAEHNWIGYDDEKAIATKLDFVKTRGKWHVFTKLHVRA